MTVSQWKHNWLCEPAHAKAQNPECSRNHIYRDNERGPVLFIWEFESRLQGGNDARTELCGPYDGIDRSDPDRPRDVVHGVEFGGYFAELLRPDRCPELVQGGGQRGPVGARGGR